VLTLVPSLCGSSEVDVPAVCSARNVLQLCTNFTLHMRNDSSYTGVTDMESYMANFTSAAAQIIVLSQQVITLLKEQVVMQSSVAIARTIVEFTEQLHWSRVTILADVVDRYFLHTAEVIFKWPIYLKILTSSN